MEHLRFILRGKRSTWSTFIQVRKVRRQLNTMDAGSFCVTGAAVGAPQAHSGAGTLQANFAWQLEHLEHLSLVFRGKCSTWSTSIAVCRSSPSMECTMDSECFCVAGALGAPESHFAWQAQHLEHVRLMLRGRCSTWIHHQQHNTISTTSSTQHHCHNTIATTSSSQLHQHITIYATPAT